MTSTTILLTIVICTLVPGSAGDEIQANGAIRIKYYCETSALKYDLDGLSPTYNTFSYAIAHEGTDIGTLHASSDGSSDCLHQFTKVQEARKTNGYLNLPCPNLLTKVKPLVLYLMKSVIEDKGIVGGPDFEMTELPCDISDKALVNVNNSQLHALTSSMRPPAIPDLLDLTVTRAGTSQTSNFIIGELLQLNITVEKTHTPAPHYLTLESCTAKSGSVQIDLYKFNTSGTTIQAEIVSSQPITTTTLKSNTPIGFKFYAFRFANSDKVLLECIVKVCNSTDCPQTDLPKRRRRSASDEYNTASATFEVHDNAEEVKSGQQKNLPMLAVIFAGIILLYTMFQ